jgi:heme/copper-type cytochrome/quinol oxidase subunit 2
VSDASSSTGLGSSWVPGSLAGYLKSVFPEVANATAALCTNFEEGKHKADMIRVDSSFFKIFDLRIVEGSMDLLSPPKTADNQNPENRKIAITREKALQMFGNESPVGKKILNDYFEICAVVSSWSKHSNYPFDFVQVSDNGRSLVELVPGTDMKAFEKKLNEHNFQRTEFSYIRNIKLVALTSVHYEDPAAEREVQFQHIIIFALAGLLLILCTLFNCLTLFVCRFRMRQRELALRTVYGASGRSLFAMLSVEFIMSLTAALILGLALINILRPSFLRVSGIRLDMPSIYLESVIYMAVIILVSLTVFFLTLAIFRRRTLNASISGNKKILRKTSVVVQLIISIVFAFCTLVIMKQMYYLHNSADLGFALKNRGSVHTGLMPASKEIDVLNDKMKQIPEIQETVTGDSPLLPIWDNLISQIYDWDGKQEGDAEKSIGFHQVSKQYARFYELELIEGEYLEEEDGARYVLINESAAKVFGWDKAVGKSFSDRYTDNSYVVKGVIKNIYNFSPTIAAKPFCFYTPNAMRGIIRPMILFKYNEGSWKTCMEKITKILEKEFSNIHHFYNNIEEEYSKYLKSENTLLAILTIVSLVCLTVCVFGFVSMVSLSCEERRKEIAVRKVNGATIKDILDIFFREHLSLLAVGALIAFPAGYVIMKRWLEHYVIQTEISAWIYLSILLALALVIITCVGGRVYKTSRENPVKALNR